MIRGFIINNDESDVKVNIKTCFGNETIKENVPLEEYLASVLYAEENPSYKTNREYLKAFVIFARTYTLKRGGYKDLKHNLSIKSCSSDQNWCDYEEGCYREQTLAMFNECIDFALSKSTTKPYYSAKTCANRVTTFPGTKSVKKENFEVTNPLWPASLSTSAIATANTSVWKKAANESYQLFLKEIVKETDGLVLKNAKNQILNVGYMLCNKNSNGHIMCMNKAKELGNKGYSYEEIIKAFTLDYTDIKIVNYKKQL